MLRLLPITICLFLLITQGFAQHPDLDKGKEAYGLGRYDESIGILKRLTKEDKGIPDAWYYLGRSYLGNGKAKDSIKPLEKAVKLKPENADFHAMLGYAYLTVWDRRAENSAKTALKLNARNALANLVLSVVSLRAKSYEEAAVWAKKALEISPKMPGALFARSKALVSLFASEPYPPRRLPEVRLAMLDDAASDLERYLHIETSEEAKMGLFDYLKSIRFFADYYRQPGNLNRPGQTDLPDPSYKPLHIKQKSAPSYTPSALSAHIEGTVIIIVEFRADGSIGHVIIGTPLEDSLDNAAVDAAKSIKFEPPLRNGVAESQVRRIEYSFGFH